MSRLNSPPTAGSTHYPVAVDLNLSGEERKAQKCKRKGQDCRNRNRPPSRRCGRHRRHSSRVGSTWQSDNKSRLVNLPRSPEVVTR